MSYSEPSGRRIEWIQEGNQRQPHSHSCLAYELEIDDEPESLSYVLMANRERRQLERRFAARQEFAVEYTHAAIGQIREGTNKIAAPRPGDLRVLPERHVRCNRSTTK
jgi:hypothetical protein